MPTSDSGVSSMLIQQAIYDINSTTPLLHTLVIVNLNETFPCVDFTEDLPIGGRDEGTR